MRNFARIIPIFLFLLAVVSVPALGQEDMRFVDRNKFEKPARPSSAFSHDTHNENAGIDDCSVCHHLFENGKIVPDESSEDQSCMDCHTMDKTGSAKKTNLRKAFHSRCKGCHMERKSGPVMCGECHKKTKK